MTTTLGDRIKRALDSADMKVKDLERALEDKGVDGGSYANLHRLKSDKLERPSAGLLYGIAKATGVRLPWLVAGDGPPTEEEEEVGRTSEAALRDAEGGPGWKRDVRFKWEILTALGFSPPDLTPSPDTSGEPIEEPEKGREELLAWARSVNASHIPHWLPPLLEAGRRLDTDGEALGKALRGPLAALELDADAMTREQVADYITAMIPALLTLEQED